MRSPTPTIVERMVAALLRDRQAGETAVPALQRAGFTGPEIATNIDHVEATIAFRTGAETRNPELLAQTRALAAAFGASPLTGPQAVAVARNLYPRLLVVGSTLCLQTAPGATLRPVSVADASHLCGIEAA